MGMKRQAGKVTHRGLSMRQLVHSQKGGLRASIKPWLVKLCCSCNTWVYGGRHS